MVVKELGNRPLLEVARPENVCDVRYGDLVADPVGTVRAVYEHHGLAFTDAFAERLGRYVAENPQHRHGEHCYAAVDFGYSDSQVRKQFESYTERFGVTPGGSTAADRTFDLHGAGTGRIDSYGTFSAMFL